MDYFSDRDWMYNRHLPGKKGIRPEFYDGVEVFVNWASQQRHYMSGKEIRCPCAACKNCRYLDTDSVRVHLYKKGFLPLYRQWTCHGEPFIYEGGSTSTASINDMPIAAATQMNMVENMVHDAVGPQHHFQMNETADEILEEMPNAEAQRFYDLLEAGRKPIYTGHETHTELSAAVRLMTLKSEGNFSQQSFNDNLGLLKELLPSDNLLPDNFYEAKKMMSKLGLTVVRIDCCLNGCMLFRDDVTTECLFCGEGRYVIRENSKGRRKRIPVKRLIYLPLIPRLQRLFASMSSAQHMRWHHENRRQPGVLCHPSDGEAWKTFDDTYPDFACEPRNVRLGLCSDGFSPFGQSASPYSCWPVIVTPYNLPPEMCMTTPYMFLTLIIPGPHSPKGKIDVYLQPLIEELKLLWEVGVPTYDVSMRQNFCMKAALMWTINDFPAYDMLSGWSTAGKFACPYCMEDTKSFSLKHGGKTTWFDCHRRFLPLTHQFRRNKDAFFKNRVEKDHPPTRLSGEQIWQFVCDFPKITETNDCSCPGNGVFHNWTRQSIFWELPYWKTNLIRHNLDVMHIEKNVFDNVFNTVMDVKGKTKDNLKARMDLKEYCRRRELHLHELANGKIVKPKAKFALTLEQKRSVCAWVSDLAMPDGYASNLRRCVNVREAKLYGMKSHDCHVFMERLLPIAFACLPDPIWKPLAELSKFFRDLCSTVLRVNDLNLMEANIVLTTCKLERIFPPGFFNSMEHLPIHLPYEARVGGPVQYRWMYPFERFLNKLKRMVKNKARVEGSICEAYLCYETSHFCSYYFDNDVQTSRNRVGRNDEGSSNYPRISIFNHPGRPTGKSSIRYLSDKEYVAAHLHVLLNCPEVDPYIQIFEERARQLNPNITDANIQLSISRNFASWFREYVYSPNTGVHTEFIRNIAYGPSKEVTLWNVYFVNGFKFHTKDWSVGKKTINSGVCVKVNDDPEDENYYYGHIKEIVQLEYIGEPTKQLILFNCDWFDHVPNRGVKIDKEHGIVEVRHRGRYAAYDPFIFAQNAIQVYYVPYPKNVRSNSDWLVVIRTKPRGTVDVRYTLEVAYQETSSLVNVITRDDIVGTLRDEENDDYMVEDNIETNELEEEDDEEGEEEDEEEEEEEEVEEEEEDHDDDDDDDEDYEE